MIDYSKISLMFDVSAVQANCSVAEIRDCCDLAAQVPVAAVFSLAGFTPLLKEMLDPTCGAKLGGGVGYPSGGQSTALKIVETKEMVALGCEEIDMTTNIGAMKSGLYGLYYDDIKAVVEAADGLPVKSILEVCYLTDDEIKRGAELAAKAGVTFIKSGTGWGPRPTVVEHIRLMKQAVGDSCKIKAAGGVRDLATVTAMIEAGCSRFGVGVRSIKKILAEIEEVTKNA